MLFWRSERPLLNTGKPQSSTASDERRRRHRAFTAGFARLRRTKKTRYTPLALRWQYGLPAVGHAR